jgi:ElaA protein
MSGAVLWGWYPFDNLGTQQLYEVLALRQRVFILEQHCAFPDADGRDVAALHLLGRSAEGVLVAYLRAFPPEPPGAEASLGRVVVHREYRGSGLGRSLVEEGLRMICSRYHRVPVRVAAQLAVERFYQRLGFERQGDPFEEDGITHVAMMRSSC